MNNGQEYLYEPIPGVTDEGATGNDSQEESGEMEPIYAKVDKTNKAPSPSKSLPTGTASGEGVTISRDPNHGDFHVAYSRPNETHTSDVSHDIPFIDEEEETGAGDPKAPVSQGQDMIGSPSSHVGPGTKMVNTTHSGSTPTTHHSHPSISSSQGDLDGSFGDGQESESKNFATEETLRTAIAGSSSESLPGAPSTEQGSMGDVFGEGTTGGSTEDTPEIDVTLSNGALEGTGGAEAGTDDKDSLTIQEGGSTGSLAQSGADTDNNSPDLEGTGRSTHDPGSNLDHPGTSSSSFQEQDFGATPGSEDAIDSENGALGGSSISEGANEGTVGSEDGVVSHQQGDLNAPAQSLDDDKADGAAESNSTMEKVPNDHENTVTSMEKEGAEQQPESSDDQINPGKYIFIQM